MAQKGLLCRWWWWWWWRYLLWLNSSIYMRINGVELKLCMISVNSNRWRFCVQCKKPTDLFPPSRPALQRKEPTPYPLGSRKENDWSRSCLDVFPKTRTLSLTGIEPCRFSNPGYSGIVCDLRKGYYISWCVQVSGKYMYHLLYHFIFTVHYVSIDS
jgi:hypothetical protein